MGSSAQRHAEASVDVEGTENPKGSKKVHEIPVNTVQEVETLFLLLNIL